MIIKCFLMFILSLLFTESDADASFNATSFEENIKRYAEKDYPGQDLSIIFDYPDTLKKVPNHPTITTYKNLGQGRIQIRVKDVSDPISAKIDFLVDVPVLNKPLSPSHLIEASDIVMTKVGLASLNGSYALHVEDLVGKKSRQKVLGAMTPIQTTDLMAPLVIKRDALVRIIYHAGNLSISSQGKALKDGAVGQRVTFEVGKSAKKVIEAVVVDAHTAEIHAQTF
ncbi:MAG: flagellar basal body P-ring formation chaperone FlgA [Alphaproteobacteria bacterium]|nr:flagellar basal body P-ring formation chaperone FlgA [Alphaproteobacteria bacterium]